MCDGDGKEPSPPFIRGDALFSFLSSDRRHQSLLSILFVDLSLLLLSWNCYDEGPVGSLARRGLHWESERHESLYDGSDEIRTDFRLWKL